MQDEQSKVFTLVFTDIADSTLTSIDVELFTAKKRAKNFAVTGAFTRIDTAIGSRALPSRVIL